LIFRTHLPPIQRRAQAAIKMSEHHEHTEFLKHCLRYDDSPERHVMMERLNELQHELRVVKVASWLMGGLVAVAGASLASATFVQKFPNYVQQPVMNIVLALFAALSFCLLAFILLAIFLYRKLHRQREASRQLLMRLLATRFDSEQQ
jgi:hypothetical protein